MVERAQASKVGGNGERTTATTVGRDWDPISILGNKRANGDDDIWFSCYGFSSFYPSVKVCCMLRDYRMLCWRLHGHVPMANSSWSPASWMLPRSKESLPRDQYIIWKVAVTSSEGLKAWGLFWLQIKLDQFLVSWITEEFHCVIHHGTPFQSIKA